MFQKTNRLLIFAILLAASALGNFHYARGAARHDAKGASSPSSRTEIEACSLLTSADIKAVQGEAVQSTKPSSHEEGWFTDYQCFYSTPTFTKSVSLQLLRQKPSAGSNCLRDFWKEKFHVATDKKDDDSELEREGRPKQPEGARGREEEEEGRKHPPQPVAGIGDEAYWASAGIVGALYVLKSDSYLRISVGGADDDKTKLEKCKALARKALRRMK
jgi:hypothetical protein